jgi:type IV pilus assembly protein PilC
MPIYSYTVKKSGGKPQKGQIESESVTEATKKLRAEGFLVLELNEGVAQGHKLNIGFLTKRVSLKEKIIFTRQLSVMIKAGLPIVKSLDALKRQTQQKYFKEVIESLSTQLKGGQTLSKAMMKYPKVFSEIYTAVVKAGEETGQLSDVLLNLADQQEKEADLIGKIKGAMIYPIIILLSLVGVAGLIVFFVLPSLEGIFADSGQELPILTRILLGTSTAIREYFLIILPIMIAAFYGMRLWFKTKTGQAFYDRLKISVPVFGSLTKKVYMARFSRTLAMLIKASLPILLSIRIIRKTISNVHYDAAFQRIDKLVESGKSLSAAIDREPLFPPMVSQLTSLGEESGTLEGVLLEIATFYDKEVDTTSKNLSTLLEPLLLIIMGVGVAFVVAAVLGPIYGLVQNFGG